VDKEFHGGKEMKKQKCGCCCFDEKPLKIYFCPKCRSKDVGYCFGLKNIFGILPKMRCRKCGFEMVGSFPILVVDKAKLKRRKK
jgi:hypothetical protein